MVIWHLYIDMATWFSHDTTKIYKLRPGPNGTHFADDIFKCIFLTVNVFILVQLSLQFVSWNPVDNESAFVKVMAWCRIGTKPLPEPMLICHHM